MWPRASLLCKAIFWQSFSGEQVSAQTLQWDQLGESFAHVPIFEHHGWHWRSCDSRWWNSDGELPWWLRLALSRMPQWQYKMHQLFHAWWWLWFDSDGAEGHEMEHSHGVYGREDRIWLGKFEQHAQEPVLLVPRTANRTSTKLNLRQFHGSQSSFECSFLLVNYKIV